MRSYAAIVLACIVTCSALLNMSQSSPKSEHIHWSAPSTLRSPDGKWLLQVRSGVSENAPANVYLSHLKTEPGFRLFELQRDAEVYWRTTQDVLVVVDEKASNDYRILVFNLKNPSEKSALVLNEKLLQDVKKRLGSDNEIVYYFPRFSQWLRNGNAVIAVGVVTAHNGSGPFAAHCFGYIASDKSQSIQSTVSDSDLKRKYGASCQIWP